MAHIVTLEQAKETQDRMDWLAAENDRLRAAIRDAIALMDDRNDDAAFGVLHNAIDEKNSRHRPGQDSGG